MINDLRSILVFLYYPFLKLEIFSKMDSGLSEEAIASIYIYGARGSVVVKVLCYRPEGRWFDTR
jgi:hypothetical protein